MDSKVVGTDRYMAPEVRAGEKYNGKIVDIFGAGIILFMMRAKKPPFQSSTDTDDDYSNFFENNHEEFWAKYQIAFGNENYFSNEFMDLVNGLLACKPSYRPSISEIREHPWVKDTLPTQEEVINEFKLRHRKIRQHLNEPRERISGRNSFDTEMLVNKKPRRCVKKVDKKGTRVIIRKAQIYYPEFASYHRFFSETDLDKLWNILCSFVNNLTSGSFTTSQESYTLVATVIPEEEEYKDTFEDDIESIELTFAIYKLEADFKHCVELTVTRGNQLECGKYFSQLLNFFGGHIHPEEDSNTDLEVEGNDEVTKKMGSCYNCCLIQ